MDLHTSFKLAVREGRLEDVKRLINSFRPSLSASWFKDYYLLRDALQNNHKEIAKLLITSGAKVNSKCSNTPLHFAARNGDVDIVEMLLRAGANINAQNTDRVTPLYSATECGKKEVVKVLLECGANVDSKDKYGRIPLHVCAEYGYPDILETLLKFGAGVNSTNNNGETPLHSATECGYKEVVDVLLESGANVDSKARCGTTPVHMSAKKGYQEILETLLKFGADINSTDDNGRTPLHEATENLRVQVVATLLKYGSDVNIADKRSHTPSDIVMGRRSYSFGAGLFQNILLQLRCHIVKLKTAKLYVSEGNLVLLRGCRVKDYQDKCEKEVESMKRETISNSFISFYDILTKGTSSLAMYMRNDNVYQILKSEDYKSKFPLYESIIECNFRRGMVRKELLEQGHEVFHFLCNTIWKIPYECAENIFSYLSNKDLRMLIDLCK